MYHIKNNSFHCFRYKFLFIFLLLLQSCNTTGSLKEISNNISLPSMSANSFTKSFSLPKLSIPLFKNKCTTLCNPKFVKDASLADYKIYLDTDHTFDSVNKSNGWTPIMYLLKYSSNDELIFFAFENSKNLDVKSNSGTHPLHIAAQHQSLEIFNELITLVKNKNPKTQKGMSLIHFAAQNKSYDIIVKLIEDGEDINQNHNGWTPLSYAALNGSSILIDKLISLGANKDKAQVNDWNNYSNWVYPDIPPYSTTIANKETKYNLTTSKNTFYTPGNTTHIADYSLNKFKKNVLTNVRIEFDGTDRINKNADYFLNQQIYQHFKTNPKDGIYVYSFSLTPSEYQPSGSCNFSNINYPKIYFSRDTIENFTYYTNKAYIYIVSYKKLIQKKLLFCFAKTLIELCRRNLNTQETWLN